MDFSTLLEADRVRVSLEIWQILIDWTQKAGPGLQGRFFKSYDHLRQTFWTGLKAEKSAGKLDKPRGKSSVILSGSTLVVAVAHTDDYYDTAVEFCDFKNNTFKAGVIVAGK